MAFILKTKSSGNMTWPSWTCWRFFFLKIFLLKTFTRSGWATGNLCSSQLLKCSTIFREDYCRLHGPGRQANVWQLSKSPIKFYSCGPVTWWPQQGSGPCGRFILFQPAAETENSSFKRKSIHRSLSNLNAIASINSKWRLFLKFKQGFVCGWILNNFIPIDSSFNFLQLCFWIESVHLKRLAAIK